ncbi:MAG: DUF4097 family beta strand repeat-containing protein [Candidatus Bipolaricaulota bacterium]
MNRSRLCLVLGILLAIGLGSAAFAQMGTDDGVLAFGFGGGGVAAFFPDLEGINAFLSENGLSPLDAVMIGGGGGGRGGVVGGPSIGGMGFGVVASSSTPTRAAEFAIGAGGLDLGLALGGDKNSVLTVGTVLGGGASVLTLSFDEVLPAGVRPTGIIPVPTGEERVLGRAFAFAMPYVSMEAQILPFLGVELRIGYLLPVFGADFGEDVGVPAPSLDLSGVVVGLSVVFGGIGGGHEEYTEASEGRFGLDLGRRLAIEIGAGEIVVSSYVADIAQTPSGRIVEWAAVERAGSASELQELSLDVVEEPDGVSLRSAGIGTIDLVVRLPAGTDLDVDLGAGTVRVVGHSAQRVALAVGAGDIAAIDLDAEDLDVALGAGTFSLSGTVPERLEARAGVGEIALALPQDASATISASAGIGEVEVSGFTASASRARRFFLSASSDVVLGGGEADLRLSVGVGEIRVSPEP